MTIISDRVGIQTISWGPWIEDLASVLESLCTLGYHGVEFAQPLRNLPSPDALRTLFASSGLTLLGLAGGDLMARTAFGQHCQPLYLYADEWDQRGIDQARSNGLRVALHPHVFKGIGSIAVAAEKLDTSPDLSLIVDTAHVYLAGEDFVAETEKYLDRIIAVHLKDWNSSYGRGANSFARGFTRLGRGELSDMIKRLVDLLLTHNYSGWVVVEQDTPEGDPLDCAAESRQWLRDLGV
jgi:sugar phosphate isomerase/epimerase